MTQMPCPHRGVMPSRPLAWALLWSWAAVEVLTPGGGCPVPVPKPGAVQGQWARSVRGIQGCIRSPLMPWGVHGGFGVPLSWLQARESRDARGGSESARGLAEERGPPGWGPLVSALPGQVGALLALLPIREHTDPDSPGSVPLSQGTASQGPALLSPPTV